MTAGLIGVALVGLVRICTTATEGIGGRGCVVGGHRAVRDVLEHARNPTIDVTHANRGKRHDLAFDAEDEFPHVRKLRVRVNRVGAGSRDR